MISMRLKLLLLPLLSILILSACRSTMPVVATATGDTTAAKTTKEISQSILSRAQTDWDKLQVPITIRLMSPQSASISGTMSMCRGRDMLISLRYWGFEIGVLYLDDTNVLVLDKVHKKYVYEPIDKFLSGFNVTIANVQDLMLGRVFILGTQITAAQLNRAEIEHLGNQDWCFIPSVPGKTISYGFTLDNQALPTCLMVCAEPHQPVTIKYDRPCGNELAKTLSIDYVTGKLHIDADIDYNLSKIKYGDDVKIRKVTPPDNYQRIDPSQLSSMIKF